MPPSEFLLPDYGFEFKNMIDAAIALFGSMVVSFVGVYFAFLLVRKGMEWGRAAFAVDDYDSAEDVERQEREWDERA